MTTRNLSMLRVLSWALWLPLLSGCASAPPKVPWSTQLDPLVIGHSAHGGVLDARGRFREILCAVNADHGAELPDYRPCEETLTEVGVEPPPSGAPVSLAPSNADYLALMVPGLGYQCIKAWLHHDNSAPHHVATHGYEATVLEVDGLSGSAVNARIIRDYVMSLPADQADRPLILIGHSKGAPDILQALVTYPELAEKVVAMVAYAGAVGGSLLADDTKTPTLNLLTRLPYSECDEGDHGALHSLSPAVRRAWLKEHELPGNIRYYSLAAFPEPSRISWALKSSWRRLGELQDARNDSQLVFYDQVIPGSRLLAFTNADHWAMAVPAARQMRLAASTFATQNDFPREVLLESLLRFIEEDLAEPAN
jgi:pimeloyl-ACP methyl ester carboxylesterase